MVKLVTKPTTPNGNTFIPGGAAGSLPDFSKVQAWGSANDDEYFKNLVRELDPLPQDERKRLVKKYVRDKVRLIKEHETAAAENRKKYDKLTKISDAYRDLIDWMETSPKLERADHSKLHDLRKSVATGHAMYVDEAYSDGGVFDYDKHLFKPAEIMVVQHDWGGALSGGEDIQGETFKLPYDICAFEFQWGGRRFIAFATEDGGTLSITSAIETKRGWLIAGRMDSPIDGPMHWTANNKEIPSDDSMTVFVKHIGAQIRAICVALDAEVAETEIVRERHDGSKSAGGKLKPFHIVRLTRRGRSSRMLGDGTGPRKRLHFRRGHWRHFETFKVWVKWCLVGNPDLGFIDKEYRL